MRQLFKKATRFLFYFVLLPIAVVFLSTIVLKARYIKRDFSNPRFLFGSTPIISFSHWAKLLVSSGFSAKSFVSGVYSINGKSDWDIIQNRSSNEIVNVIRLFRNFADSLLRFDVFVMSCDGFLIGQTKLWRLQSVLLQLSGCKTIVFPYGGDSYVYSNVKSNLTLHGLMLSYPDAARKQGKISKQVQYWVKNADVFIPGPMGLDGFGRWDVPTPSPFQIDLDFWKKSERQNHADGKSGEVVVVHAPNHRGFKGTELISKIIGELKQEGLKIKFVLLENFKNSEVKVILTSQADILIDQILATGYALNAVEGMASGIPVISNLENKESLEYLRIWSFLNRCPIVSADYSNIKHRLRTLIESPDIRSQVGLESRKYAEDFHGKDACKLLFTSILAKLNDKNFDLQRIYESKI